MRKHIVIVLALFIAVFFLGIVLSEAGQLSVYGRVTDVDGVTVVSGAEVIVSLSRLESPWVRETVKTNSAGNYYVVLPYPEIDCFGVTVRVLKTDTLPFKEEVQQMQCIEIQKTKSKAFRMDISISDSHVYPNASIIQGCVGDALTDEPLPLYSIFEQSSAGVGSIVSTNSSGKYKMIVNLGHASSAKWKIKTDGVFYPVAYIDKSKTMTLESGKAYTVNFFLEKNESRGYVAGRVIDACSKKPIPFARITIFRDNMAIFERPETDFLGRYNHPLIPGYSYAIYTTGSHVLQEDSSLYISQRKEIGHVAADGKVVNVDFQMVRKNVR